MQVPIITNVFFALSLLVGSVSSAISGNNAYTIQDSPLAKSVFTSGYKGGREAVVRVMIDPFDYKITAKAAWNAHDTTPNRLHLNEILMALWEDDGLRPRELVSIEFSWIVNEPTKAAIASARGSLGLSSTEDFRVTSGGSVWSGLMESPFGKVAQRMASEAGKDIVAISVTDNGLDDMAFELA